jgi:hypothetical protein
LQGEDLALIQRDADLHQGAMRIYDDGVSFFTEGGLIGQFPLQNHSNLKKQALAASFRREIFHYSEAPGFPVIRIWRDIKFL